MADAYSAVEEKGGTVPEQANSNNLPTAIASIPAGQSAGNSKIVKHYAMLLRGSGDITKIIPKIPDGAPYDASAFRLVRCEIVGISNIVNSNTGVEMYYGNIKISANIKPEVTAFFIEYPIALLIGFSNANGNRLVLNEEFSVLSGRLMSFQGENVSGATDMDNQNEGKFLRGVYADCTLSNHLENGNRYVFAEFKPVQTIRGDLGYTYWIDWETPICWTYE